MQSRANGSLFTDVSSVSFRAKGSLFTDVSSVSFRAKGSLFTDVSSISFRCLKRLCKLVSCDWCSPLGCVCAIGQAVG